VRPASIGLFGLSLAIMIGLVLLALDWTMRRFESAAERADAPPSPVAGEQMTPEPRLQADPAADLARLRREDLLRLSSYGWADREKGKVRLPIDRAIELLAERGFPEPKGPVELPKEQPPKGMERAP
jgi:hypothetical protein